MNNLNGYHIVLTTHNSRYSQRMLDFNIDQGQPLLLSLEEEIELTKIIGQVIQDYDYKCLAYNICHDHVHLILVCHSDELGDQIQRIKSISSKLFRRSHAITSHNKYLHRSLWSQKFFRKELNEWSLSDVSYSPGEILRDTHLSRAIDYIKMNREKHGLLNSIELKKHIESFVISIDKAYELF